MEIEKKRNLCVQLRQDDPKFTLRLLAASRDGHSPAKGLRSSVWGCDIHGAITPKGHNVLRISLDEDEEEDPEEEPEEEEIEDGDMVNDKEDDAEVINPYKEANPHNRPPHISDKETEFTPPVVQIADADDVPIPPVIQSATRAGGPTGGPTTAPMARECSFTGFMKCGATQFYVTEERFNELALLCPDVVPNEKKKVELYIKGLLEIIKGATVQSNVVCYECGERGHKSRACPKKAD
nr:hypothetical protein [Tanacetum cinerariifolium]